MKSPFYSTSTWKSMRLKEILHTLIVFHIRRATHSFSKMKIIVLDLKELFVLGHVTHRHMRKFNKRTRKINLHGSFRLHYNWCSRSSSSHIAPEPLTNVCYYISAGERQWSGEESSVPVVVKEPLELSGYLNWLEGKREEVDEVNEIDKLADLFIANCHEKFMLEKQESYRMFQEMMARSI